MEFKISNVTLHYIKCGEGKPLVLLHGNGESHKIFDKAIPILSEHFTVYALDSRTHGKSSKVESLHYEDMAEDVYEFIHGMNIEKPIVYGFSDGGIVALLLCIKHKKLLSQVIASGVNANPYGLKTIVRWVYKLIYEITRSKLFKLMVTEPNITPEMLSTIEVPVILTGGSFDMIPQEHMKSIAKDIPNGRYIRIKGESHSSYVIHSRKIAKILIEEASTM